jgi:hypothetical protein
MEHLKEVLGNIGEDPGAQDVRSLHDMLAHHIQVELQQPLQLVNYVCCMAAMPILLLGMVRIGEHFFFVVL